MYSFIYTAEINVHYVCKGIWISSLISRPYDGKVFRRSISYVLWVPKFLLLTYNWLLHAWDLNSYMSVKYNNNNRQKKHTISRNFKWNKKLNCFEVNFYV